MTFRRCLFTSSIKSEIRHVHVVVMQKRAEKCTKQCGARAKLLLIKLIPFFFFLKFSLPSASLDLKVSILQLRDHLSWPACMEIHKVIKRKQLHKTSVKLHCKTARIFAYSSTPAREHAVKQNEWNEARLARFAWVRLLRHASPISLLILRKKPTVLQSTVKRTTKMCNFVFTTLLQNELKSDVARRHESTPVSTVLRKSVRFFIINIFLIIKSTF